MSSPFKLRIAIVGAGIGGMSLAAFISQHSSDILIDVYEAKDQVSIIGAGIAIWKRTWQVLLDMGFEKDVIQRGLPLPKEGEVRGPIFRSADQSADGFDFHNHKLPYGPLTLPRPILLDMLRQRLGRSCTMHTSKRLVSYNQRADGTVTLHFEDGSGTDVDLLVGADGVHSCTRASMYRGTERFAEPKWSGTLCYRATVDANVLRAKYPDHQALSNAKIWCGYNKHVVSHPFGGIINLVCFYNQPDGEGTRFDGPWVSNVSQDEVIKCYQDWEPDLRNMLELLENPTRWAIHVVNPLPSFVQDQVALLGDAAHAMTPHQGIGGGQAIEDAHILGRLVSHRLASKNTIGTILAIYDQIRRPVAQLASAKSRENGMLYDFIHPEFGRHDLTALGRKVGESFEWLAHGGCDEDWIKAEGMLIESVTI